MDARLAAFPTAVADAFRFVVDTFQFRGPDDAEEGYVGYSAPPWWIWVVLEERNRTVDTYIKYDDGVRTLRASLGRLVLEAGLQRRYRIGDSAQTRKGMESSLVRQAEALRGVLPLLRAEHGDTLMARAAGSRTQSWS